MNKKYDYTYLKELTDAYVDIIPYIFFFDSVDDDQFKQFDDGVISDFEASYPGYHAKRGQENNISYMEFSADGNEKVLRLTSDDRIIFDNKTVDKAFGEDLSSSLTDVLFDLADAAEKFNNLFVDAVVEFWNELKDNMREFCLGYRDIAVTVLEVLEKSDREMCSHEFSDNIKKIFEAANPDFYVDYGCEKNEYEGGDTYCDYLEFRHKDSGKTLKLISENGVLIDENKKLQQMTANRIIFNNETIDEAYFEGSDNKMPEGLMDFLKAVSNYADIVADERLKLVVAKMDEEDQKRRKIPNIPKAFWDLVDGGSD